MRDRNGKTVFIGDYVKFITLSGDTAVDIVTNIYLDRDLDETVELFSYINRYFNDIEVLTPDELVLYKLES